jgi:hypothetical protein
MRKAVLLATVMAFVGADFALAAPFASAGKTAVAKTGSDLTLVKAKKKRVVRRSSRRAGAAATGGTAATPSRMNSANPSAAPSGQNPSVDQGMRTPKP